jgi:hypothetical protein
VLGAGPVQVKDRRVLRAVARWTAAALVFAALGGAAAYGVTQPRRTDIPGLATPDDGRWTYEALKLPKLPAGMPRALDVDANPAGRHYADLRKLLLPAPAGAKADKGFTDSAGWVPTSTFLKLYEQGDRAKLAGQLSQDMLRHIAARAWTMPDGTRAEIYLLQFGSTPYADRSKSNLLVQASPVEAPHRSYDSDFDSGLLPDGVDANAYDEDKPYGARHLRYACVRLGDTIEFVLLSGKGGSSPQAVPFHQTVTLQSQLLG